MFRSRPAGLILFILSLTGSALAWDNDALDSAWRRADISALQAATGQPGFTGLYAHYRIAMLALEQDNKDLAEPSLDVILDRLKDNYQTADEAALFAMASGLSIALKPWRAPFVVGAAEDAQTYCFEQAPQHPVCHLLEGTSLFNAPSMFGGDKAKALTALETSISLNQTSQSWGYEDALLLRARTLQALERTDEARQQLSALLKDYPDFAEARRYQF